MDALLRRYVEWPRTSDVDRVADARHQWQNEILSIQYLLLYIKAHVSMLNALADTWEHSDLYLCNALSQRTSWPFVTI